MANQWENDFRYQAIQASIKRIGNHLDCEPLDLPFSFCLPVGGKPVAGWITPGRIMLAFLILGFAGLIAGAITVSSVDDQQKNAVLWMTLGASFSLTGMLCFFLPILLHKWITGWCVGSRGQALLSKSQGKDLICCELGNSAKPGLSIDGDDHVIVLLDRQNRRLLVEGVAATYVIHGDDVLLIRPFEFMSYLGADIIYRIDEDTTLRLGIAKVNALIDLKTQAPLFFFVNRWIKNWILKDIVATLQPELPQAIPE